MSKQFKNKYRIEPTRLKNWDYGWNAPYFLTICTKDRFHFFGEVLNGQMVLNEIGMIAHNNWLQIPNHFPFVILGNFVVMPNHVHGIVIIDKPDDGRHHDAVEARLIAPLPPTEPIKTTGGITGHNNPMLQDNLSKIIRWYKGRTTFELRKKHPNFAWQPRYHDHIIRNDLSFHKISEYIINNPLNWSTDQFR